MRETIFNIIQLVLAVLLVIVILLQQKGAGVAGIFGGAGNVYSTKRGVDKILHWATIALSIVFFGVALLRLI